MNHAARIVDAGYWIALVNVRDTLHRRAREVALSLRGPLVTTEAVVVEVGNSLSLFALRNEAVRLLRTMRADRDLDIVPATADLVTRAIELYAARMDKEWGLTDRISFVVMEERRITEALTHDVHFLQAGFRALPRE